MNVLTIYEIRELVKLLEQTDVESVEVKNETSRLAIKRRTSPIPSRLTQHFDVQQQAQPQAAPTPKQRVSEVLVREIVRPVEAVPAAAHASVSKQVTENLHKITSPMVGTFYRAPAVDAPPYVQVHDRVEESTVVCIVEAMKLFNEIEADVRGEIVEVLVENGQLVEPGQPLFLVKREG